MFTEERVPGLVLRVRPYSIPTRPAVMASRPKFGFSAAAFPITAKILPKPENLKYLVAAAIAARFVTGIVRVFVDATDQNPNKTKIERANSTWERLFIEIFGTLGNVLTLHAGQDIAAWLLEKRQKLDPALLREQLKGLVPSHYHKAIEDAMKESFGEEPKGIIARVLYGDGHRVANIDTFRKNLNLPELMPVLKESLNTFAKRLNHSASLALVAGIALSAFFGGIIVQLVNDYAFSKIEPYLNRLVGLRDNRLSRIRPAILPVSPDLPLAQRTFRS